METLRSQTNTVNINKRNDSFENYNNCLFCSKFMKTPAKRQNNKNIYNNNLNSKMFNYFCKAYGIFGTFFIPQFELSPFCADCSEKIEFVAVLMESLETLELKLNMRKDAIVDLLRKPYRVTENDEEGFFGSGSFSPSEFRKQLVSAFKISPTHANDEGVELIEPVDTHTVESLIADNRVTCFVSSPNTGEDSGPDWEPSKSLRDEDDIELGRLESKEKKGTEKVREPGSESIIIKNIPEGIVIRDCYVALERVDLSSHQQMLGSKLRERSRKSQLVVSPLRKKRTEVVSKVKGKEGLAKRRNSGPRKRFTANPVISREFENGKEHRVVEVIHMRRPGSPKKRKTEEFKCSHCDRTLKTLSSLRYHVKILHDKIQDFVCETCGESFHSAYLLMKHGVKSHGNAHPYRCDLCGEVFFQSMKLVYHSYHHTGKWPFICEECGSGFETQSRLERHKQHNHFGNEVSELPCKFCDKKFPSQFLLDQHEKRHSLEKIHKCSLCTSAFRNNAQLRYHMKGVHTKKRPFLCQLCGADFKTKSNLRTHLVGHNQRKLPFAKRRDRAKLLQSTEESENQNNSNIDQVPYASEAAAETIADGVISNTPVTLQSSQPINPQLTGPFDLLFHL